MAHYNHLKSKSLVFSLAGVLYFYTLSILFAVHLSSALDYIKEQAVLYIELEESLTEPDIFKYEKKLKASSFIKESSVEFISKTKAEQQLIKDLNLTKEERSLLEGGVLPNVLKFALKKEFVTDFDEIITSLKKEEEVADVIYNPTAIQNSVALGFSWSFILILLLFFFIFVSLFIWRQALLLEHAGITATSNALESYRVEGMKTLGLAALIGGGFGLMNLKMLYNQIPSLMYFGNVAMVVFYLSAGLFVLVFILLYYTKVILKQLKHK